jgi:hypothetical protein
MTIYPIKSKERNIFLKMLLNLYKAQHHVLICLKKQGINIDIYNLDNFLLFDY